MKQLNVVVPGLLGPFADAVPAYIQQQFSQAEFTQLNRFLSRANKIDVSVKTYFETRVDLIYPQCDMSLCQLSAQLDGIDISDGFFYRADPVHFKAESDHAVLVGTDLIKPTENEASRLVESFNQHFLDDKLSLHFTHKNRWYLKSNRRLNLTFTELDYALGRDIKHFMPQNVGNSHADNNDALWWRKILNEAQMLFFQHEVNQSREDQRQMTINGLWLWDVCAPSTDNQTSAISQLFCDDDISTALAKQADVIALPVNDINSNESCAVLVFDSLYESVCYGDIGAWLDELTLFCKNDFSQVMDLLLTKKIDEINFYPCNGEVFKITRLELRKFWKKQQTIDKFMFAD